MMIRLLEFDYHGQSCQSKILFRFNFSIFSLGRIGDYLENDVTFFLS